MRSVTSYKHNNSIRQHSPSVYSNHTWFITPPANHVVESEKIEVKFVTLRMKREALAWLLLAIFFLVLSHFVCESSATPKHNEITRATQLKDLYRSKEGDEQRRVTGLAEAIQVKRSSEKAGRGVYGGGDTLHPRAKKRNGADPLLLKSSSVLSTILRQVVGLLILGVFS